MSLTGSTNSGKTFSALRLARGIAGPKGKIAVIDTEGGRTLAPQGSVCFRRELDGATVPAGGVRRRGKVRRGCGLRCVPDRQFQYGMGGLGGVLEWQSEELEAAVTRAHARNDKRDDYRIREANKMAAWIKPKVAHKAMVYSLLQRRIPIIFSIRGEETIKPGESGEKPTKIFKVDLQRGVSIRDDDRVSARADRKGCAGFCRTRAHGKWRPRTARFSTMATCLPRNTGRGWRRGRAGNCTRARSPHQPRTNPPRKAATVAAVLAQRFADAKDREEYDLIAMEEQVGRQRLWLESKRPELSEAVEKAAAAALARVGGDAAGDVL